MSINVGSRIVAEARIQALTLRAVVGAYEIVFAIDININEQNDFSRRAFIVGARASIKTDGNGAMPIGFARPESFLEIKQGRYSRRMTESLVLSLQPGQLAAIERLRDSGDVAFDLLVSAVGTDESGDYPVQDEWHIHVPRSDWIKKLDSAGARNILLLEVPLPLLDVPEGWADIAKNLKAAEENFRNGDYHGCVAACRNALEELGHQRFGTKDWAKPLLDRFANNRLAMTQKEREEAIWAAVRHYAHLAHHGGSEGGVLHYSRAEAQLVLTMVATLAGSAQAD